MHLYKDIRATSRGQPTNAIITQLKKVETPIKIKGIHPRDNHIHVDLSGAQGNAIVTIYTDGSKTEKHVGASMAAMTEIHTETQKLNKLCTVFQAELCGILMAVNWIQRLQQKRASYAINVDSKAALLAIANRHTNQPIAVAVRLETIKLKNSTSNTFHWVKGHAGLKGNERADYLAKIAASYNTTIAYDEIPINQGKQILEDYYIKIWSATYINSVNASHTKLFIPTIFHRLSISLWPNFILTQFLTNHGSFQSYLLRMKKTPSPTCRCPNKAVQMTLHVVTECSLFSKERPTALHTNPPLMFLKHHIHTVGVTTFLRNILLSLQEQQ